MRKIKFQSEEVKNLKDWCGLRIYEMPKQMATYVIGADVAEGVGRDASVAQVVNIKTGLLAASYWSNFIDTDNYAAELYKLGMFYNKAHLIPEFNNNGQGVIALLGGAVGGLAYPNLYKRIVFDEYTQKRTKKIGFKTTVSTKPRLIENLKAALRDGEIIIYDKATIQELSTFVRDEKSGRVAAKGSAKDDRVMALALAWEQARQLRESISQTEETHRPRVEYDSMTGFPCSPF